jgi:hypothetical protein
MGEGSHGESKEGREQPGASSRFAGFQLVLPSYPKGNTLANQRMKLIREQARMEVTDHLVRRGIVPKESCTIDKDVSEFATGVRGCFNESIHNCYRETVLQAIGEAFGTGDEDLLDLIGKAIPTGASNVNGWKDGTTPFLYDMQFLLFAACDFPISAIPFPDAARVIRRAIARTLMYVRAYPPDPQFVDAGRGFTEREAECWRFVRSSRLFRDRKPLDRRILDEVESRFPDLILKSGDLYTLKDVMDNRKFGHSMMIWLDYWSIFIYSTRYKDKIYWLWDRAHPQYPKIWSSNVH